MELLKLNGTATIIRINRYFANKAIFAKIAVFSNDTVIKEFYSIDGKELVQRIKSIVSKDPTVQFGILDVNFDDGL